MCMIRTRFAPSPTGFMHVGGVRTALFAWILARQSDGQFLLRLEDTDKTREVKGSAEHIMKSLQWLGLQWDEGPGVDGPHAPYLQSERLKIYDAWAKSLIKTGRAYADPFSAEEVDQFRADSKAAKKPFLFRNYRPENPPNWDGTKPLRFKSEPKAYSWHDEVLGDLSAGEDAVDDFIIMKSDGYPTYNFAHIVDDMLMEITHVIRSQEFTASVPRFLNLYEALDIKQPKLATLPYVMGPDGKKKLGKRDGAKDILEYAREGYLPETMINFLATLGWNDGTEQEIFSVKQLIEKFSLERVQKSGAAFDEQRLLWMNGAHIRGLTIDDLYERSKDYWPESSNTYDDNYKKSVLALIQERLKYLAEIPDLTNFFFEDLPINAELITNNKQLKKVPTDELKKLLDEARSVIEKSDFSAEALTKTLNNLLETTGQKPGILFSLVRMATTQAPASPGLADTLSVLGRETALRRIDATLSSL
jgi:glutamyl-tRNA synthetase